MKEKCCGLGPRRGVVGQMLRAAGVQKRKKCLGNNIVGIPPCVLFVFSFLFLSFLKFMGSSRVKPQSRSIENIAEMTLKLGMQLCLWWPLERAERQESKNSGVSSSYQLIRISEFVSCSGSNQCLPYLSTSCQTTGFVGGTCILYHQAFSAPVIWEGAAGCIFRCEKDPRKAYAHKNYGTPQLWNLMILSDQTQFGVLGLLWGGTKGQVTLGYRAWGQAG